LARNRLIRSNVRLVISICQTMGSTIGKIQHTTKCYQSCCIFLCWKCVHAKSGWSDSRGHFGTCASSRSIWSESWSSVLDVLVLYILDYEFCAKLFYQCTFRHLVVALCHVSW
jgi:hypothetical protein